MMTLGGRTALGEKLRSWACAISYALHRGRLAGVRLSRLLLASGVASVLRTGYSMLSRDVRPATLAVVFAAVAACAGVVWCERQGFLLFIPDQGWFEFDEADLAPETMITARGSGTFAVEDRQCYLVEAPVTFWTTRLGEHVLAAYVRPFRVAGVVGVSEDEMGWWYLFIDPRELRRVVAGHVLFRGHRRRVLKLVCSRGQRAVVTYLSCDDEATAHTLEHQVRRAARLVYPGPSDVKGTRGARPE